MIYHAIDPGPEVSGYVKYSSTSRIVTWAQVYQTDDLLKSMRGGTMHEDCVTIEDVEPRGMPMGRDILETIRVVGQMQEIVRARCPILLPRSEIKLCLCGSTRAKDGNVTAALRSLFAKWHGITERMTRGSKKKPGPLYAITSHCWAALAVAVVAAHGDDVHILKPLEQEAQAR